MTFKQQVHLQCAKVVNEKISLLQHTLRELKESASNETKSTAGDKHETALAMLQIEQANTGRQLSNFLQQKLELGKINPTVSAIQVAKGSLVKTNKGYLFISIALGTLTVDGLKVIALSPLSPLGSKLLGLKENGSAVVNGVTYLVLSVE